jgi:hypothetical protein
MLHKSIHSDRTMARGHSSGVAEAEVDAALLDVLDVLDAAAVELQDAASVDAEELQVVHCQQEAILAVLVATAGELPYQHHHHHQCKLFAIIPLHILFCVGNDFSSHDDDRRPLFRYRRSCKACSRTDDS